MSQCTAKQLQQSVIQWASELTTAPAHESVCGQTAPCLWHLWWWYSHAIMPHLPAPLSPWAKLHRDDPICVASTKVAMSSRVGIFVAWCHWWFCWHALPMERQLKSLFPGLWRHVNRIQGEMVNFRKVKLAKCQLCKKVNLTKCQLNKMST